LDETKRKTSVAPPLPGEGFFSVFATVLTTPEKTILQSSGPDALIFSRFFRLCAILFLAASVLGSVMLIINLQGENNKIKFDQLSISNVKNESHSLMVHVASVWIIHLLALYLMFRGWIGWVTIRHAYLAKLHSVDQNLTVLTHNIPKKDRSDEKLSQYFNYLYPINFHSAIVVKDVHKLTAIIERRQTYLKKLEHSYGVWGETGQRPQVKEKKSQIEIFVDEFLCSHHCEKLTKFIFYPLREKIDAIEFYTYKLNKYNSLVSKEQSRLSALKPLNSGFITFKTALVANTAVKVEHNPKPFQYQIKPAPLVHDIYWPSLMLPRKIKIIRTFVVDIIITLALIFWIIPITLVNTLSQLATLEKFTFIRPFTDAIRALNLTAFVEGYLPSIGLMIVMALLPLILRSLCRFQGIECHSWIQLSLLKKYFLFQIFNFFIVNALSSVVIGLIRHVDEISHYSVSDILDLLSIHIPIVAPFFINFIMLRSLTGFPLQLARIWPLFWGMFSLKFRCKTEREKREIQQPPTIDYGEEYPEHLLIFTVGVTYAAIAPVVLPFVFLYFFLGYLAKLYQSLYMYVPRYESGGMLWPSVFQRMTFSLLLSQLTMIGIFTLRDSTVGSALLLPLPIITIAVNRYVWSAYWEKGCHLPVEIAEQVDRERKSAMLKTQDLNETEATITTENEEGKEKNDGKNIDDNTVVDIADSLVSPALKRVGSLPEDSDAIQRSEHDIAKKSKKQDRNSRAWGTEKDLIKLQRLQSSPSSLGATVTKNNQDIMNDIDRHEEPIIAPEFSLRDRRTSFHPSVHIQTASIKTQQEIDRLFKQTLHPYTQPELLAPTIVLPDIDAELKSHASFASMIDAALSAQSARSPSPVNNSDNEEEEENNKTDEEKLSRNINDNTSDETDGGDKIHVTDDRQSRWNLRNALRSNRRDRSINVSVDAGTALLSSPHHDDSINYTEGGKNSSAATNTNSANNKNEKSKNKKHWPSISFNTNEEWGEGDDDV